MSQTLPTRALTSLDKALISDRPRQAKATLDDKTHADPLSEVVIAAAKRAYGKQGAAAAHLGKDEGNFSRDAKAGRITTAQLKALGPSFLAEFGRELLEEFGTAMESPQMRAQRVIRETRQKIDELEEFVRYIA